VEHDTFWYTPECVPELTQAKEPRPENFSDEIQQRRENNTPIQKMRMSTFGMDSLLSKELFQTSTLWDRRIIGFKVAGFLGLRVKGMNSGLGSEFQGLGLGFELRDQG